MPDSNLLILEDAAQKLRALLDSVVFVGGATLGLLITDTGAAPIRATVDVDVIAEITTRMEYFDFSERLRRNGFTEDARPGAPVCRWLHDGLVLDLMPLDKAVLGFTNRWYGAAECPFAPSQRLIFSARRSKHFEGEGDKISTRAETWRILSLLSTGVNQFLRKLR